MPGWYNPYIPGRGRLSDTELMARSLGLQGGPQQYYRMGPEVGGFSPRFDFSREGSGFNVGPQGPGLIGSLVGLGANLLSSGMPDKFGWMTAPGPSGVPEPVFNTNFRLHDRGTSSFQNVLMRQYQMASGAYGAGGAQNRSTSEAWGQVAKEWANGNEADEELLNSGLVTKFLPAVFGVQDPMSMARKWMGYDSGAAANMFAGSHGMAAMSSLRALNGNLKRDLNPFGEDFDQMRTAAAYMGTDMVNRAMYGQFDNNGNFTGVSAFKNRDVNGASEKLVGEIVSRAIQDNAEMFVPEGTRPDSPVHAKGGLGTLINRRNELLNEQKGAVSATDEVLGSLDGDNREKANKIRNNLDILSRLPETEGNAQERGEAQKAIDEAIEGLSADVKEGVKKVVDAEKDVSRSVLDINRSIDEGTRDLVKNVTGAIDSMKDVFGSEEAASQALEQLTGGKGFSDSSVATRVRDQIDEMKILAMNAGMSPEQVGQVVGNLSSAVTAGRTNIAQGGGLNGQMALAMGRMFMEQMPAGNSKDQARMAAAQSMYANANASSRSFGASTMLASLRDIGRIDDAQFERLGKMLSSGNGKQFQEAVRAMASISGYSERDFNRMITDKALVDTIGSGLSAEGQARAAGVNATAMMNETGRLAEEGIRRADRGKAVSRARETGASARTISRKESSARFDAAVSQLSSASDDNSRAAGDELRDKYEREYKQNGHDAEKAKQATMEWATRSGVLDNLTDEQRAAISKAGIAAVEKLADATGTASGEVGNMLTGGKGGGITAAGLGKMREELSKMSSNDRLHGVDGKRMNISAALKEYDDLIGEGKVEEAQAVMNRIVGGLDTTSRRALENNMRNRRESGEILSPEDLRKQREDKSLIDEAMQNKEISRYFAGVTDDDAKLQLAKLGRQWSEARNKKGGPDQKSMDEAVARMREIQARHSDEGRGDIEKAMKAIAAGDTKAIGDLFRNGNISREQFESAMNAAGMSLGNITGLNMASDMELLTAKSRGAESVDDRLAILTGQASNLSSADVAGLRSIQTNVLDKDGKVVMKTDENGNTVPETRSGLDDYVKMLTGGAGKDENGNARGGKDRAADLKLQKYDENGNFTGEGRSYQDAVDTANDRSKSAAERKQAEIDRLRIEQQEFDRQKKDLLGDKGEKKTAAEEAVKKAKEALDAAPKDETEESRKRRRELQDQYDEKRKALEDIQRKESVFGAESDKRRAKIAGLERMGDEDFALQNDRAQDAKAEEAANKKMGVNLEDLTKTMKDIKDRIVSIDDKIQHD